MRFLTIPFLRRKSLGLLQRSIDLCFGKGTCPSASVYTSSNGNHWRDWTQRLKNLRFTHSPSLQ